MIRRAKKIEFSSPLHRRNVVLGKNETYYGFVLGTRYNRQHYWDYKGLFEYGLCLPHDNPLGAFTVNTKGLKRLLAGDYDQAIGMERKGRARWHVVKTAFRMAAMMHTDFFKGKDTNIALAKTDKEKPAATTKETPAVPTSISSPTSTVVEQEQRARPAPRPQSQVVFEGPPRYLDERMLQLQRAGYAQIKIVVKGNALRPSKTETVSLPTGRSSHARYMDNRLTQSDALGSLGSRSSIDSRPGSRIDSRSGSRNDSRPGSRKALKPATQRGRTPTRGRPVRGKRIKHGGDIPP